MVNNVDSQQQIKQPGAGAIIGGVVTGSIVKNAVASPHNILAPHIMEKMAKISSELGADEFSKVANATTEAIKTTGLDKKGVDIIKATPENAEKISEIMNKEINNNFLMKHLPKKIKEFFSGGASAMIEQGNNACYTFASKKIIMPEKELSLAFFHEAGHAMNANLSKVGKILQKCRPMTALMIPISIISLWKTKKAPGEEPKNGLDKVTTFIKNNAGKLTFAAFLPMLAEEGLATIKGNQLAKKLLSPDLAKKVAKTNALGFSTYLMLATLSSVGIYLGTKVKDAIASRKLVAKDK